MARQALHENPSIAPEALNRQVTRHLMSTLTGKALAAAGVHTQAPADDVPVLSAEELGQVYETCLAYPLVVVGGEPTLRAHRTIRRGAGIYYTPRSVVDHILAHTLGPWLADKTPDDLERLRMVDLSCGAGAFLLGAARFLFAWYARQIGTTSDALSAHERARIVNRCLYGLDNDPLAVEIARAALMLAQGCDVISPAGRLCCADVLAPDCSPLGFPEQFDLVVGNPPYLNVRRVTQVRQGAAKADLRARFNCARGNFDLYVLFLERGVALLADGGRLGMIVPNKLATADYARRCRQLLIERTHIERITDLSHLPVFRRVGIYPMVVVVARRPASATALAGGVPVASSAMVPVERPAVLEQITASRQVQMVTRARFSAAGFALYEWLDVESRVPTVPLGRQARVSCGTPGYQAHALAAYVRECDCTEKEGFWPFITSGNIDRYRVVLGSVRFMKRIYHAPGLPVQCPLVSAARRALFQAPKIVLAGMCRRLEAAYVSKPLALGVQVFALSEWRNDPLYLLALLNSTLFSFLYAQRFWARRLSGGFFAVNKGPLIQLPVYCPETPTERRRTDRLLARVEQRMTCDRVSVAQQVDQQIDEQLYDLYALTPAEIAAVERWKDAVPHRAYDSD